MTKTLEGYDCTPLTETQFKWLSELLNYKKTTRQLQNDKGYCCLGVACELFVPEGEKAFYKNGHLYGVYLNQTWNKHLVKKLCLVNSTGSFKDGYGVTTLVDSLTDLNDNKFAMNDHFRNFLPFLLSIAHHVFTNVDKPLRRI